MKLQIETKPRTPMVLRQTWVDGDDPDSGATFESACGAGLGNTVLSLTVKKNGDSITEHVDIRDLIVPWVTDLIARLEGC